MESMNRYLIMYDQCDEDTGVWYHYEDGVWEAKTWQDAIHSWKDDNLPTGCILLVETPSPDGKSGRITLRSINADYPTVITSTLIG